MKFEIYPETQNNPLVPVRPVQWRLRLISTANGKTIADSAEGYNNVMDCIHGIDLVMGTNRETPIDIPKSSLDKADALAKRRNDLHFVQARTNKLAARFFVTGLPRKTGELPPAVAARANRLTSLITSVGIGIRAYSTPNWTPIPRQTGHPFHGKLDSQSSANWTPIPLQTGQFEAV